MEQLQGKNLLKILYLRNYLLENSDEEHPVTVPQMIAYLEKQGIPAERKSIYRDLALLDRNRRLGEEEEDGSKEIRDFWLDLHRSRENYYVGERRFTLQETKLLVDMVQSSNFITRRKTEDLIRKITSLASVHQAKTLNRTVYVRRRIKAMNESVYQIVDKISEAINNDEILHFQYFTYN